MYSTEFYHIRVIKQLFNSAALLLFKKNTGRNMLWNYNKTFAATLVQKVQEVSAPGQEIVPPIQPFMKPQRNVFTLNKL